MRLAKVNALDTEARVASNVRFWHLADISAVPTNVRFWE